MSTTDAIAIFAEGTFEDQIAELAGYIAQSRPEPERAPYLQSIQKKLAVEEGQTPLSEDVGRRRDVFSAVLGDVKGLGEGTEREIEGFFNLIYAHLLTLWPIDSPETINRVSSLLPIITSSTGESAAKYRILSNLFNTLPRQSALRFPVHTALLELASSNDELQMLQVSRSDVEKWLKEWDITPTEKSAFLKTLVAVFSKAGQQDTAYYYKLALVRSLEPTSQSAQPAALDAIATALSNPTVFDFDPLFKLDAVVATRSHPLFALLRIFFNGGLDDLHTWQRAHADISSTFGLDAAQLERKIRLLSLADLGFQNIGQDLPYTQVATLLQVSPSEVERWVIDAIRVGLLTAKLAQPAQTLRVTRATARAFGPQEWALLVKRLAGWRAGLAGVLDVVATARRRNDTVVAVVAPGEKQSETPGEAEGATVEAAS
ncbi:PCI-domain-containing protein [Russula ochroleuca]|uniref:Eukaryotic translation initiation factor 3 subunit M n=1 Tax=Russula ochroleuca TaxID=152965 RepID=A0A9P5JUA3_9AGAM|nr:PCI-domain-containing protein [Russula ochroleuca]KAF8471390.1 PCI-domain-containing protein [Russula ochroleuca]